MAENVNIKVTVDAGIKTADKEFKDLAVRVKELDYQFRQQKISADGLKNGIDEVNKKAQQLNLTYKQTVDLGAQIYQVQQRAANSFTSLSGSLASLDKKMNTANQTLISMSQGLQDAGQFSMGLQQGMRGVANNIQQVSQMFALLYKETGSAKGAFSLMISQLNSPAGLLVGLAAVTSAIQILPSLFREAGATSKEVLEQMTRDAQNLSKYGFGYNSAQSLDVAKATISSQMSGMTRVVGGTSGEVGDIARVEIRKGSEADYARLSTELKIIEEFEKKNAEVLKQERERAAIHGIINKYTNGALDIVNKLDEDGKKKKKKLQEAGIYGADSSYLFQSRFGDVDSSVLNGGGLSPFQRSFIYGGGGMSDSDRSASYQNWLFNNTGGGVNKRQSAVDARNRESDSGDSELQDKVKMYDNLFFNPMKDGFNDLNSVIRNELFGTLDEMKNRFGVVGASIIQSLNAVIAKLIEVAIASAIVTIATGGTVSFGTAFSAISSGTSSSGSLIMGGRGGQKIANSMATGGTRGLQRIQVVGETRLAGNDILITYRSAEAKQNLARIG